MSDAEKLVPVIQAIYDSQKLDQNEKAIAWVEFAVVFSFEEDGFLSGSYG